MKRLHVHVAVDDLQKSIGFYSTLFAVDPTVLEVDYAKWMLDDPRVNFAISSRVPTETRTHVGQAGQTRPTYTLYFVMSCQNSAPGFQAPINARSIWVRG